MVSASMVSVSGFAGTVAMSIASSSRWVVPVLEVRAGQARTSGWTVYVYHA